MPSDSNGVYTLPAGYLAVTGETIQASQHNPPLEDIASSLTARLMRSGVAPMTGPQKFVDGTVAAPGIQFVGGGGFYKTASGVGVSYGGAKVGEFIAGGYTGSAIDLSLTGFLNLPARTTALRPVIPTEGQIALNTTTGLLELYSDAAWNNISFGFLQPFQCQLTKSGANLLLSRKNGKYIFVNGAPREIPQVGVTLSPSGLIAGTTYNIYVTDAMVLEASTTARTTDATDGHQIKTGDATRSFVGMGRIIAGPAWVDTATQRFVRSYYNDPGVTFLNTFSTNRSATTGSFAELNSEIRNEGIFFSDDIWTTTGQGDGSNSSGSGFYSSTAISLDGIVPETPVVGFSSYDPNSQTPITVTVSKTGLTEGYHYATVVGKLTGGVTTYLAAFSLSGSARRV